MKEQSICGTTLLEKYTIRFKMPYYHKDRSSIFRKINYATFAAACFLLYEPIMYNVHGLYYDIRLFTIIGLLFILNLIVLIVNETLLKNSIQELTEPDLYSQGNMKTVQEQVKKLLENKFYELSDTSYTNPISCNSSNVLCNFPSKLQDRLIKRIKIDNDLTDESVSNWITTKTPADGNPDGGANPAKYILSYLNFSPESTDLTVLMGNSTLDDMSERKNFNYIHTANNKIDVNDRNGIITYFKNIYSPYIAITIVLSIIVLFAIFMTLIKNNKTVYIFAFIIILYLVAYISGLYIG
jgi:hypothetical protein